MDHPLKYVSALVAVATFLSACASLRPGEVSRMPLPSPREHLARGMAEVEAADALRREKSPASAMGGVFSWPPDMEKWQGHLRQAEADFRAVLDRFPESREAAEAQFMLGRINDHPHRNRFDAALVEYRRTMTRFPGTPAAEQARQRIEVIESINR